MFSASGGSNSMFVPSKRGYASSIGTNNMCGFASFVATINAAILNPEKFYPAGMPKHTEGFMRLYMDNLECNDENAFINFLSKYAGRDRELQTLCAMALKTAFTECMAKEFATQTSFDVALGVLIIAIITDDQETINRSRDYSELLIPAIKSSGSSEVLWKAYNAYLKSFNYDESKRYDTAAFMRFLSDSEDYQMQIDVQGILATARQIYAEKILTSSYMATEVDLIYLAHLAGLKGIAIETTHSSTPAFTSISPENVYTIELKNYGVHWEAKSLPKELTPILNQKVNNGASKKTSATGYSLEKTKEIDALVAHDAKLSDYIYTRDDMSANIKTNVLFLNDDEINKNLFPGFIGSIISDLRSLIVNLVADAEQKDLKEFLEKLTVQLDNLEKGNLTPEPIKIPLEITSNKYIDKLAKEDLRLIIDAIVEAHGKYLDLTRECNERLNKENENKNNKNNKNKGRGCNIM